MVSARPKLEHAGRFLKAVNKGSTPDAGQAPARPTKQREFKPNTHLDRWPLGFQLRVRDEAGTRYFVNVSMWDHTRYGGGFIGWEVEVTYNDGTGFTPHQAAVQIKAYAGVNEWTPAQVVAWAAKLWDRLTPHYYEKGE